MVFFAFALVLVGICWKTQKWKNWREYYPTILYVYLADLVSDIFLNQKPLWAFNELSLKYPIFDLSLTAFLYPATVILLLSAYKASLKKLALTILLWVALYSGVEYLAYLLGDFKYYNDWTILHSAVLNVFLFSLASLHFKKPLWAMGFSIGIAYLFLWLFKIPLSIV